MKIKNYIPVILCSIALCSCSDADKNIAFGLDSDAIKAEAAGGSHKIKVSASGDWVATTDEPWISISPANGRGTTECRILIDSALTDSPRRGVVRIQEQNTWDKKEITIDQQGFDYAITLGEKEVSVANFSAFGTRYFDVKVKTNVDFAVEVPTSAESWLKYDSYKVELDRGIRPREVTVRFNWSINSQPNERIADVVFKPKREVELARQDNLLVTQGAAEPIEENTRSGDSIALLAIARTLGTNSSWENGERMDNWDDVTLWEEGMAGYTPEKNGRVILVDFWSSRDPQSAIRNAELKELYERFGKQTLAIYQVSLDEVKAEWIDAVQKQQLPWTCVFDPRGTAGIAAMSYNVQSVPTNVLIDRSGRIAGKNLYGERLSSKISELAK